MREPASSKGCGGTGDGKRRKQREDLPSPYASVPTSLSSHPRRSHINLNAPTSLGAVYDALKNAAFVLSWCKYQWQALSTEFSVADLWLHPTIKRAVSQSAYPPRTTAINSH